LSETIPVVDSTTYYVTQTLNGCVSDDLAVTAYEVDCGDLEVTSFETDTLICHGVATLRATGSGAPNTELYWYENDTIEDKLANGSTFKTPELNNTTSYWVSEVFLEGEVNEDGYGKEEYDSDTGASLANYGVIFEAYDEFTLASVDVFSTGNGGVITVELRDSNDQVIDSKD